MRRRSTSRQSDSSKGRLRTSLLAGWHVACCPQEAMRAVVVGVLLLDTAVANAQRTVSASAREEGETTVTGYDMPQPVPGSTPATGEREPEEGPPSLTPMRYVEDYSYLRDPVNRTGAWWESLKYIPLTESEWVYLTLGDELRLRGETFWNNGFGSSPLSVDGPYLRYRQFPYADLHLGDSFRVFAQLLVAYGTRSEITKNPFSDQTGFELGQAIVEWRTSLGDAGELALRGGRQVLVYGSGRFLNAGPNIRLRFDGGVVQWERGDWRLDLFLVKPVRPRFSSFDDWPSSDITVWSAYATHRFRDRPKLGLDLEYIGYINDQLQLNAGTGKDVRHTLGARFFGYQSGLFWDVEAVLQLGSFAEKPTRAWGVSGQSRYTRWDLPLNPWVGLRVAATSGDNDPTDATLETFNPMFAEGGYYGESGVIGPINMINLEPGIGAELGAGIEASFTLTWFWRESTGDGVYTIGGSLLRPDAGSDARFIGTQPEVNLIWNVDRNLTLYAVYSMVIPGLFIEESGPADTVYFTAAHMQWRY